MTLLEQLQAHKGGLIQLKTQLYWYDGRGYDGTSGRICLILDAAAAVAAAARRTSAATAAARRIDAYVAYEDRRDAAAAFLLIDGQPQWVWVAKKDIALLVNDPPTN